MGHDTTPTGSTTRLVSEKNKNILKCCCCPVVGASSWCSCINTVFVVLSLSFTMGNVIRLPRMAYEHGDGTFMAIYIFISIFIGVPLAFLEIVLGQFCQQGTTKLWRAVPILKGVGIVKVISSVMLVVFYPTVMTLSLFYALWTIKGPLPFTECVSTSMIDYNRTDKSGNECLLDTFLKPPDQDPMWFGVVVTLLFLLWAFIILSVSRGVKSIRLSAVFIVILACSCLAALLSQQISIGQEGYRKLLDFSWEPVKKFETWYYAFIQFFLSTQLGFGNVTTFAGNIYSKSNAFWTALFYIVMNVMTGIAVTVLAYMLIGGIGSYTTNDTIPQMFFLTLIYDASLKFTEMPLLWSSLAYLLVILAGFASMAALIYTIVISIIVETKNKYRSWLITACTCAVSFIVGILLLLPSKAEVLRMLDDYVIGHIVMMSTGLELIGFLWIYGVSNLCNDFEFVLGHKLLPVWTVIWCITPIIIIAMEAGSVILLPVSHEGDAEWMFPATWSIYGAMWLVILICAIWQISVQVDYNICQKVASSVKPSRKWGPVDPMYRHGWVQWRDQYQATGERDFTLKRRGTKDYTHSVKSEHRYNTMSLPRTTPSYIVQVPHGLDMSDHVCWPNTSKMNKM